VLLALGAYDRSRHLIVDPVFLFNSAGEDVVRGVEVDANDRDSHLAEPEAVLRRKP
jgi:hypothetical protein